MPPTVILLSSVLLFCACATKKPCVDVPPSDAATSFGVVLPGGHLCKDEGSVATVDYPDAKPGAVAKSYEERFTRAGWSSKTVEADTLILTRGEADTLFVVAGDASKDRGVPFAVVRYCGAAYCRKDLTELADALAGAGTDGSR